MKKLFITTPIYYASGKPHIGHAYTTILADVIARYKKADGYDVFFLTGMDEHGQKIADTAKNKNKSIQTMLDETCQAFKQLWKALNIDYSRFVRTTDEKHCQAVQKVFSVLKNNDFIYEGTWSGLYCVNCEENYTREQAVVKDGRLYCKVGHELTMKHEKSYFLRVNDFAEWINDLFNTEGFILPKTRINELRNSFIDKGLEDLSVTRTSVNWGIPTLEDPNHVIYVWIDALLSYLTGLGFMTDDETNFNKYWNDKETEVIHLMSKEITRFHCIYWPILLHMLGLRQPTNIISHGWVVTKEGKMSKSLGNIIDPFDYIKAYGSDALRYFIIRQVNLEKDGIFSDDLFIETFNSELANNYGNMATRVAGMIKKYFNNVVPGFDQEKLSKLDKDVIEIDREVLSKVKKQMSEFKINDLIDDIQGVYKALNKYIDESKPWVLAKDPSKKDQLSNCLHIAFTVMIDMMSLLAPILVETTEKMERIFHLPLDAHIFSTDWTGHKIDDIQPVFVRIEKK